MWQAPIQVSGAETTGTAIGGDVKTNSAGDVFAFWPDTGSRNLFVAKSTNGGHLLCARHHRHGIRFLSDHRAVVRHP